MKKTMKRMLAVFLTALMISSAFTCMSSAVLNEDAVAKHKGQYKNYLLLGDSVASGYRDEVTDNDSDWNEMHNESTYWRVPGSYADVLANAIIDDKSMTAFAGPGFRTIEIRYMLEDDYAAICDDEYLFHPSQLYVYEDYGYPPGDERIRKAYQQAVKDADLITLGVGGNDWGAYLSWVVTDVLEEENVADEYIKMVEDIIAESDMDLSALEDIFEVAHIAGALPALISTIPDALNYGLRNFYTNWDIMIADIYAYNPDVTLMVLGMSDNSLKGNYFDYPGVEGEKIETEEQNEAVASLMTTVIDFIMSVGNKPMIDGAEKFGYTYVNTDGTTYVDSHPDAAGHEFIANKIIEALPDAAVYNKYEDMTTGNKYYNAVEYVVLKGIMTGTSETTFSPDSAITKGQLAYAMNVINKTENATDSEQAVSALAFSIEILKGAANKDFAGFFKTITLAFRIIVNNGADLLSSVTRAEAAQYLKTYCEY